MRAMQFIVTVYKADSLRHGEDTTEEVRRAVNWLHAKYGGVRYDE